MTVICVVIRHIYTISSSSSPLARGRGARASFSVPRARCARFLRIIAVSVESALTTNIPIIHSGSCSYVICLQSEMAGIIVLFSISVCLCVSVLFIPIHNTSSCCYSKFINYTVYKRFVSVKFYNVHTPMSHLIHSAYHRIHRDIFFVISNILLHTASSSTIQSTSDSVSVKFYNVHTPVSLYHHLIHSAYRRMHRGIFWLSRRF